MLIVRGIATLSGGGRWMPGLYCASVCVCMRKIIVGTCDVFVCDKTAVWLKSWRFDNCRCCEKYLSKRKCTSYLGVVCEISL